MDSNELIKNLSTEHSIAGDKINSFSYVWEVLPVISDLISELSVKLSAENYHSPQPDVFIAKTANVATSAFIKGPCIICDDAEIRHGAFLRGKVIVGKGAVIGNSTEVKNSIIFDKVQAPHYNYIGDSVLGYKAHLGAGVILSNLRIDKKEIRVKFSNEIIETGLRKFGAIVGDMAEIGCNSVLNPGTIISRDSRVYPLTSVSGIF